MGTHAGANQKWRLITVAPLYRAPGMPVIVILIPVAQMEKPQDSVSVGDHGPRKNETGHPDLSVEQPFQFATVFPRYPDVACFDLHPQVLQYAANSQAI